MATQHDPIPKGHSQVSTDLIASDSSAVSHNLNGFKHRDNPSMAARPLARQAILRLWAVCWGGMLGRHAGAACWRGILARYKQAGHARCSAALGSLLTASLVAPLFSPGEERREAAPQLVDHFVQGRIRDAADAVLRWADMHDAQLQPRLSPLEMLKRDVKQSPSLLTEWSIAVSGMQQTPSSGGPQSSCLLPTLLQSR